MEIGMINFLNDIIGHCTDQRNLLQRYFQELVIVTLRLPFFSFMTETEYETPNNQQKNESTNTSSNDSLLFRNLETDFVTELVNLEVEFLFIFFAFQFLIRFFVNINGRGIQCFFHDKIPYFSIGQVGKNSGVFFSTAFFQAAVDYTTDQNFCLFIFVDNFNQRATGVTLT